MSAYPIHIVNGRIMLSAQAVHAALRERLSIPQRNMLETLIERGLTTRQILNVMPELRAILGAVKVVMEDPEEP